MCLYLAPGTVLVHHPPAATSSAKSATRCVIHRSGFFPTTSLTSDDESGQSDGSVRDSESAPELRRNFSAVPQQSRTGASSVHAWRHSVTTLVLIVQAVACSRWSVHWRWNFAAPPQSARAEQVCVNHIEMLHQYSHRYNDWCMSLCATMSLVLVHCMTIVAVFIVASTAQHYATSPVSYNGLPTLSRVDACDLHRQRCCTFPRSLHKTIGDRAFPVATARVWNMLPPAITLAIVCSDCHRCRLSSVHWRQNCFADRTTTHTSGNSSIDTSLIRDIYCGPEVLF